MPFWSHDFHIWKSESGSEVTATHPIWFLKSPKFPYKANKPNMVTVSWDSFFSAFVDRRLYILLCSFFRRRCRTEQTWTKKAMISVVTNQFIYLAQSMAFVCVICMKKTHVSWRRNHFADICVFQGRQNHFADIHDNHLATLCTVNRSHR